MNIFRLMVFSHVTESQALHSNHTAAGFKSPAEESLSTGEWLEDFIAFTAVITQTLKVQF